MIPTEIYDYVFGVTEFEEFSDNIRIAEKFNLESEKTYEKQKAQGCCGFIDYRLVPFLIDGKEYYYGFNYGH
jgi:hypothetical protein